MILRNASVTKTKTKDNFRSNSEKSVIANLLDNHVGSRSAKMSFLSCWESNFSLHNQMY